MTSKKKPTKKLVKRVKTNKLAKKIKTYVAMILDQSGSMASIKAETISHFNEQLEEIVKNSADMDTRISLVVFNNKVEVKLANVSTATIKPLTNKTYNPNGTTAMYDAIGSTIEMLEKLKDINKKNVAVLFVVVSDGEENSSKKYNQEHIANKIKKLQKTKRWTFTYLGANQDLSEVSKKLNIPTGNTMAFVANDAGMLRATAQSVSSMGTYMSERRAGTTQTVGYYVDPQSK